MFGHQNPFNFNSLNNNNNMIIQRNMPNNNLQLMKHNSMPEFKSNNNMKMNSNMMANNNVIINNNIMNNNMMINNNMMNNNMMANNNMMNNNMMNNNMPFQVSNFNKNIMVHKKESLKLNKIKKIESMQFINKCQDKYTEQELDIIIKNCMTAVKEKINDLPKFCAEKIKEKLKGQWLVLIQDKNNKNFEFGFSSHINYKDMIIFQYDNKIFYLSEYIKYI